MKYLETTLDLIRRRGANGPPEDSGAHGNGKNGFFTRQPDSELGSTVLLSNCVKSCIDEIVRLTS